MYTDDSYIALISYELALEVNTIMVLNTNYTVTFIRINELHGITMSAGFSYNIFKNSSSISHSWKTTYKRPELSDLSASHHFTPL